VQRPTPRSSSVEGSGVDVVVAKLELHGVTATRLPLASSINAITMVLGARAGSVRVADPVHAPSSMSLALKLTAVKPVAPCNWLMALAKVG